MNTKELTDEEKLAKYNRYKRKKMLKFWFWLVILIVLIGLYIGLEFIRSEW